MILADCDQNNGEEGNYNRDRIVTIDSIDVWHSNLEKHTVNQSTSTYLHTRQGTASAIVVGRQGAYLLTHKVKQHCILSHIDYIIIIDYVYFIH